MANDILGSTTDDDKDTPQFTAGNPMGDIATMLVQMDRAGRLTEPERDCLRKHATGELNSLPLMIRGVSVALMDAILEGNFERSQIANAVWSIDMMADALQGMQILSADLSAPAGVPNHV